MTIKTLNQLKGVTVVVPKLVVPWDWKKLKIKGKGCYVVVLRVFNKEDEIEFKAAAFETVEERSQFEDKASKKKNFYMSENFTISTEKALDKINNYASWFIEKSRRCSWKRYVSFTLVTVPPDFVILGHSHVLQDMQRELENHQFPNISPMLIFDQEEQVVVQTTNDQMVLEALIHIIENEILELEDTGRLHAKWRENRVCYISRKPTNSPQQISLKEVIKS